MRGRRALREQHAEIDAKLQQEVPPLFGILTNQFDPSAPRLSLNSQFAPQGLANHGDARAKMVARSADSMR